MLCAQLTAVCALSAKRTALLLRSLPGTREQVNGSMPCGVAPCGVSPPRAKWMCASAKPRGSGQLRRPRASPGVSVRRTTVRRARAERESERERERERKRQREGARESVCLRERESRRKGKRSLWCTRGGRSTALREPRGLALPPDAYARDRASCEQRALLCDAAHSVFVSCSVSCTVLSRQCSRTKNASALTHTRSC